MVITGRKVKILPEDSVQTLSDRILKREHVIYPRALEQIASNIIKLEN